MSVKSFLKSKIFLKQLGIAVAITFVLANLAMFMLRIYTDHGESYPVPDLNGMTIEQAERVISKNDFRSQVIDSMFVKGAVPGTVVGQVPAAGAKVKKNRILFLTVCSLSPEQVAMPKLTDIAYQQALNVLESLGLEIGNTIYKPSEYINLVLEQRVQGKTAEAGMQIPKGTRVDLVVGQVFSGEQVRIPDLVGETYSGAKNILEASSLNFGAVVLDDSLSLDNDSVVARVWKQRPEPSDVQIYQGQSIDVWLTADEKKLKNVLEDKK